MIQPAPLLRSVLFMPGSNPRALAKARNLPADAIILDLEDAVMPEAKVEARQRIVETLSEGGFGPRYMVVRINAMDTPWAADDLATLGGSRLDAVLVPKVNGPDDAIEVGTAMARLGFDPAVRLWAMVETPACVLALERLGESAARSPLSGLVFGPNDLAKDTGMVQTPDRAPFASVMTNCVMAARANGLVALDGVCNAIDDEPQLQRECEQSRNAGFDGKTLIHPSQIATANRVYAPSETDVAEASAIVAAFDDPANAGKGALRVNGRMAEKLHLDQAHSLLARAADIAARG